MNLERRVKLVTGIHGNPCLSTVRILMKVIVLNLLENQLIIFRMQFMGSDILRSLIHFEFIFVYGVRKWSSFILLQVVEQVFIVIPFIL